MILDIGNYKKCVHLDLHITSTSQLLSQQVSTLSFFFRFSLAFHSFSWSITFITCRFRMYFSKTSVAFGLLATVHFVAGHGAIVNAVGDAGGQGSAIGSK